MKNNDGQAIFDAIREALHNGTATLIQTYAGDDDYEAGDRLIYAPMPDRAEAVLHANGKTGWISASDHSVYEFDLETGRLTALT